MKIKMIGFKVGQSRPTGNRTFSLPERPATYPFSPTELSILDEKLGQALREVLGKSDFVSIRRINE